MVGAQPRRRKQCCDPTPEGAQPPQIQVRPSLRLRLTLQGEQLSAFHATPGRFSPQPLPYWALGQVSPSCQLFSQISNIACVSHGRKRLVFSKLVISRAKVQVLNVWGHMRWSSNPLLLGVRLWVLGSFLTESRSRGQGLPGACVPASSTCSGGGLLSFTQEFLEPALRGFLFLFFQRTCFTYCSYKFGVSVRGESGVPVLRLSSWKGLWFSIGSWEMMFWVTRRCCCCC